MNGLNENKKDCWLSWKLKAGSSSFSDCLFLFFSQKKKNCMHTYIYIDEHILERALLCCRPYLANLPTSMLCLLRNRQWDKNSHFNSYIMSSLVDLPARKTMVSHKRNVIPWKLNSKLKKKKKKTATLALPKFVRGCGWLEHSAFMTQNMISYAREIT
jgi:hypothetical protein